VCAHELKVVVAKRLCSRQSPRLRSLPQPSPSSGPAPKHWVETLRTVFGYPWQSKRFHCATAERVSYGRPYRAFVEEDAQRALEDCLRDEPDWSGLLRVEEIEFAGMLQSAN
jgi:hypothetical protein